MDREDLRKKSEELYPVYLRSWGVIPCSNDYALMRRKAFMVCADILLLEIAVRDKLIGSLTEDTVVLNRYNHQLINEKENLRSQLAEKGKDFRAAHSLLKSAFGFVEAGDNVGITLAELVAFLQKHAKPAQNGSENEV